MKRFLIAGLAGVSVFGAAYGFAAAVNVTSDNFGSGDQSVLSCDSDVTTSYNTVYNDVADHYEVVSVVVSGIDAVKCDGQEVGVTLTGENLATPEAEKQEIGDGFVVFDNGSANTGTTATVLITPRPAAEAVDGVHVVIHQGDSDSDETNA